MSEANKRQVGGDHYKSSIQHWDYVVANDLDYFQAQITKYVTRWKKKAGMADLEKARHFLDKYMEVEKQKLGVLDIDRGKLPSVTTVMNPHKRRIQHPSPFGYNEKEELGKDI